MRPYEPPNNAESSPSSFGGDASSGGSGRGGLLNSVTGTWRRIMASPAPSVAGGGAVARPSTTTARVSTAGMARRGSGSTPSSGPGSRVLPTTPYKEFSDQFDEAFFSQSFGRKQSLSGTPSPMATDEVLSSGASSSPTRRRSVSGPAELEPRPSRPSTASTASGAKDDSEASRSPQYTAQGSILPASIAAKAPPPLVNPQATPVSGTVGRAARRDSVQMSRMRFLPMTSPSPAPNGGTNSPSPSLFGRSMNDSSPTDESTNSSASATATSSSYISRTTSDELPRLSMDGSDGSSVDSAVVKSPKQTDVGITLPRTMMVSSPLFLDGEGGVAAPSPTRSKLLIASPQSTSRGGSNSISSPTAMTNAGRGSSESNSRGKPANTNVALKPISADVGQQLSDVASPSSTAYAANALSPTAVAAVLTPKSILKKAGRRHERREKMSVRFDINDGVHSIGDTLDLAEARAQSGPQAPSGAAPPTYGSASTGPGRASPLNAASMTYLNLISGTRPSTSSAFNAPTQTSQRPQSGVGSSPLGSNSGSSMTATGRLSVGPGARQSSVRMLASNFYTPSSTGPGQQQQQQQQQDSAGSDIRRSFSSS